MNPTPRKAERKSIFDCENDPLSSVQPTPGAHTPTPVAHVSKEIADAFGMHDLPNTVIHEEPMINPKGLEQASMDADYTEKSIDYIVQCVNIHESLIAVLNEAQHFINTGKGKVHPIIHQSITKAKLIVKKIEEEKWQ